MFTSGSICTIGDVTLEDDVLISSHVSIINGGGQHGIERLDIPIREQPGCWTRVTIGRDTWIGERATVMADVGKHCVIGAGSVVTVSIPDYAIAVGCPARVVRFRGNHEEAYCDPSRVVLDRSLIQTWPYSQSIHVLPSAFNSTSLLRQVRRSSLPLCRDRIRIMARSNTKASSGLGSREDAGRATRGGRRPRIELLDDRMLLAVNPIVAENQLPGTAESVWGVSGAGDPTLQGFATDISVNHGQTVSFKINDTAAAPYHIDIYRMGYYQGQRCPTGDHHPLVADPRTVQPAPLPTRPPGWSTPATGRSRPPGPSRRLRPRASTSPTWCARTPAGRARSIFVVRDDEGHSDILFQTSDTTWQAYNTWGTATRLYQGDLGTIARPAAPTRSATTGPSPSMRRAAATATTTRRFHAEYPMVRWLEANGYDVSYFTDVDTDRYGSLILNHKVFMSVGHDEYWSGGQRANVEAARDAGVNLAFFSGNEVYWKTRWETSIDGSGTPYRTLVCYKES